MDSTSSTATPTGASHSGSLRDVMTQQFSACFERIGAKAELGEVTRSQRPELGQFQCNGAMGAAKVLGKPPREIAQQVIDEFSADAKFAELTIAGPGFINIRLSDEYLASFVQRSAESERLGIVPADAKLNVIVDYGGPNVAKPMHVGHLRSSIIGDSIVRILRFFGHDVKGDIHLGDWGTQMGMLIYELENQQPDLPYFDPDFTGPYPEESPVTIEDLQAMYPQISARCKTSDQERQLAQAATVELQQGRPGYRALWKHFADVSIREMKEDFHRLGIDFDLWYGESDYHDRIPGMIEEMERRGVAVEDSGALVVHVEEANENKPMPPLMLLKSDGGTGYATTDLATIEQRVNDFDANLVLYVVDKRQSLHFEQVFRSAHKSGIAGDARLEHLPFGTMNGPDGRPFKTREGGVMRLKDLIAMMTEEAYKRMLEAGVAQEYPEEEQREIAQKVGIAALKYADLMNVRTADYVFDIERFTRFEGRTGSYLLYAAVRVKSILRKAAEKNLKPGAIIPPTVASERELMLKLGQMADAVELACDTRMPHHLCAFAYDLGQEFSRFYNDCHILSEENPARQASWLALSQLVLRQLEFLLDLLGIETPDRM